MIDIKDVLAVDGVSPISTRFTPILSGVRLEKISLKLTKKKRHPLPLKE
jgi:hypothetical protein